MLGATTLMAQDTATAVRQRQISEIQIERHNVFSPSEATDFIRRMVNRLHITTRASTVRRELLFKTGEPYDSARIEESARNLRRLRVFREVDIDTVTADSGVKVLVRTADGWSTKTDFRFRSAGGQAVYTIALDEENLLGTASQVGVRFSDDRDRNSVLFLFRRPRLVASKVGVALEYEDRSDGQLFFGQVSQPFFALESRFSFRADIDQREERVLRFFEGATVPQDTIQRRFTLASAGLGWAITAGPRGYLRWGLLGQVRREDYVFQVDSDRIPETWTGAVGGYLQWRRARFVLSPGFQAIGRREDIDLSTSVLAGFYLAPKGFGYDEDGIAPFFTARTGAQTPNGFAYLDLSANAFFTNSAVDSGSVHAAVTYTWQPPGRQFAVVHGALGIQDDPQPGREFDLGLGLGPRAMRQHAFTGDRAFFTTAEYRYAVDDRFLGLTALGIAGFVDYGGAWYHGSGVRAAVNAGIGIRLASTRSPGVEATRIDLARRFAANGEPAGWAIVVGKGFPFTFDGRLDF